MRRRPAILLTLVLGLFLAPLAAGAQQPAKLPRIGLLIQNPIAPVAHLWEAFRQGLRELGYVEGQNIAIEVRSAEGKYERLPALAAELVRLRVDAIVVGSTPAAFAAKQATMTIPIVMAGVGDPVGSGLVTSLARPAGNITGLSLLTSELSAKQLELLKEALPKVSRVAVLWNPATQSHPLILREAKAAAQALGVQLQLLEVRNPDDFERAFGVATRRRAAGLLVLADAMFLSHRTRIANLAAKSRLPAMYGLTEHAQAGGLMAYAPNFAGLFRQAATYVDKILKGAKPADLPVEQPTRFELVINMKTAKALGLTFPPSILIRADQVIQ